MSIVFKKLKVYFQSVKQFRYISEWTFDRPGQVCGPPVLPLDPRITFHVMAGNDVIESSRCYNCLIQRSVIILI